MASANNAVPAPSDASSYVKLPIAREDRGRLSMVWMFVCVQRRQNHTYSLATKYGLIDRPVQRKFIYLIAQNLAPRNQHTYTMMTLIEAF
jgi:hypothetical protein